MYMKLNNNLQINEIRYFMNMAVHAMNSHWTKIDSQMSISICQNEIRKAIRRYVRIKITYIHLILEMIPFFFFTLSIKI